MAEPKKKQSKMRRNKRRSHHSLRSPSLCRCPNCNSIKQPHRPCPACGRYRGKVVIEDVK